MKSSRLALVLAVGLLGAAPAGAQIPNPYGSSGEGKFYGLDVASMSGVVFVLDLSGSMAGQTGGAAEKKGAGMLERGVGNLLGGRAGREVEKRLAERRKRVEEAKREVSSAIEGMDSEATFDLLYFEDRPHLWKPSMIVATDDAKEEADDFLHDLEEGGGTGMMRAMEEAFSLSPSVIILVSDGEPTDASGDEILARVAELNPEGAVTIHTVVVGDDLDTTFMKALAERNGGQTILRGEGLL